jgi:anti-sigma-K factor RskA
VSETPEHGRWADELAAYALGALERPEADAMKRHLDDCERCRERLQWLEPAVDVLPASVSQLEPPSELRKRLIETVRGEAAAKAPRRRRPRWLAAPRPAIALGAMAAVAAGVAGYALHEGGDETSTLPVEGTAQARRASGELDRTGDSGTLRVNDMPRLQGRDVYEVWLLEGRAPKSSGVFVLDRDRGAAVAIPSGLDDASQVMVTQEPPGGSRRPTTEPVVRATLD